MNKSYKFITAVISIILLSLLLLCTAMAMISKNEGSPKNNGYDTSSGITAGAVADDGPTSQKTLQERFAAMTSVDGDSITLITKEYLDGYWKSNYEKKDLRVLTQEEMLYIIQDTENIYYSGKYSKIVISEYGAEVSDGLKGRFPSIEKKEYSCSEKDPAKQLRAIYDIIWQRVKSLSSPEVFIKAKDSNLQSYIIGYSENTDRELLVKHFSGEAVIEDKNLIPKHFTFNDDIHYPKYRGGIFFNDGIDEGKKVMPSIYLITSFRKHFEVDVEYGSYVDFDLLSGEFIMGASTAASRDSRGTFKREGDKLILSYYYGETVNMMSVDGGLIFTDDCPWEKFIKKGTVVKYKPYYPDPKDASVIWEEMMYAGPQGER